MAEVGEGEESHFLHVASTRECPDEGVTSTPPAPRRPRGPSREEGCHLASLVPSLLLREWEGSRFPAQGSSGVSGDKRLLSQSAYRGPQKLNTWVLFCPALTEMIVANLVSDSCQFFSGQSIFTIN